MENTITVPELVGEYVHIARDRLQRIGLDVAGDDLDGVPITAATWPGLFVVTAQDPAAGTTARRGDQVRITYVADGQARGDVPAAHVDPDPSLTAHARSEE